MRISRSGFMARLAAPFRSAAPDRQGQADRDQDSRDQHTLLDVLARVAACLLMDDKLETMLQGAFAIVA